MQQQGGEHMHAEGSSDAAGAAAEAARRARDAGTPFFWRVANGVMYAEMPLSRSIRPPLLSEWESDRVQAFRNRDRRARWLAGRALAKVLVKERMGLAGIVEIREGADGEPLVYADGFPMTDVWLGITVRHGKVCCVLADRPVSLDVRRASDAEAEVVDGFVGRSEQRVLRRLLGDEGAARSAGWAIKEAAQRASRTRGLGGTELREVRIDASLGVAVGDGADMDVLALRCLDGVAVAVVGRFLLEERRTVRIVLEAPEPVMAASAVAAAVPDVTVAGVAAAVRPGRQSAGTRIHAAMLRARRIAEARMRWHGGGSLRLDPDAGAGPA